MNKQTVWWLLVLCIVAAAAFAYLNAIPAPAVAAPNPDGASFVLALYNGAAVPVGERYTLSFKGDLIRAKFCNSMSGHYTLADGVLESDLATTQMSCSAPDDVMALEENFWKMLGSGSTATFAGGKLTLSSGLRTMVFAPAR